MGKKIQIDLIGKPGCHLCEDAEAALESVLTKFAANHPDAQVEVTHLNILDDEALAAKHGEEIPVVHINGAMHSYWRIDASRLSAKLEELI